ncbi:J domain-containing protein [Elusimicrobiota bacterium]
MTTEEAYAVLGVQAGASPKEVQLAYRKRAMERHPDRASSEAEVAYFTKRFMEVRDAYEHLRREGFPVPEPQEVVEDPPEIRTVTRVWAKKKEGEDDDISLSEKLGLGFHVTVESIVMWGILIPGGIVLLVLFLRFLFGTLRP